MINKEEIFDFLHKEFGFKNLIDLEAELNICSIVNPTLKKTLTDEYGFDFRKGDTVKFNKHKKNNQKGIVSKIWISKKYYGLYGNYGQYGDFNKVSIHYEIKFKIYGYRNKINLEEINRVKMVLLEKRSKLISNRVKK